MPTRSLVASDRRSISQAVIFHRGEDVMLDFQLVPPTDCSGWTILLEVASTLGGTVLLTLSAAILDGPRGTFRVSVAAADTASLAAGRFVWDCRRTDAGFTTTLADGVLDLRREVTA